MGLLKGIWRALLNSGNNSVSAPAAEVNFLDTLSSMAFGYEGAPFVRGPTKTTTDLKLMGYGYKGAPFVAYHK